MTTIMKQGIHSTRAGEWICRVIEFIRFLTSRCVWQNWGSSWGDIRSLWNNYKEVRRIKWSFFYFETKASAYFLLQTFKGCIVFLGGRTVQLVLPPRNVSSHKHCQLNCIEITNLYKHTSMLCTLHKYKILARNKIFLHTQIHKEAASLSSSSLLLTKKSSKNRCPTILVQKTNQYIYFCNIYRYNYFMIHL